MSQLKLSTFFFDAKTTLILSFSTVRAGLKTERAARPKVSNPILCFDLLRDLVVFAPPCGGCDLCGEG